LALFFGTQEMRVLEHGTIIIKEEEAGGSLLLLPLPPPPLLLARVLQCGATMVTGVQIRT
jgi:hypothetical protein